MERSPLRDPSRGSGFFPDIWAAVQTSWEEPYRAKPVVSGMQHFLRVEGKTDSVFPGLPSLEEALAAIIVPQGWTARKPVPAQPRDKDTLEVLDKISQLCAQQVAAVNN